MFHLVSFKMIQIFLIKNCHWNHNLAAELPKKLVIDQLFVIKELNQ